MATTISAEETFHLRIANLLLQVAPTAVRVKFDKEFYPSGLQTVLNQKRANIQGLRQKRIITQKQWDLLFPNSGTAVSCTFDVTLMLCLLRNFANIVIQDKLPVSAVTTDAVALSTIKFYRNEIVHKHTGTFTEQEFHQIWKVLSQAIILLGGLVFTQLCADLKVCNLDSNYREILTELRNIRSETIPEGVTVVHNSILEEWYRIDEKVVQTKAIKRIVELIKNEQIVTVIGPPGCGKSTSIHHAALLLHKEENYDILPVNSPEEIKLYYNSECNQIFVYDDICGKYAIDNQGLGNWCRLSNEIQKILINRTVKILSSCRNYIFKDRQFSRAKQISDVYVDITSETYALSIKERCLMAEVYLSPNDVTDLMQSNVFMNFDFFPLLCQMYSPKQYGDVIAFFSNPLESINLELASLMNETDQIMFATLFLFVIYNNCIDENIFNRRAEIRKILQNLSDHFEISSVLSIKVVQLQLEKLINSYVKKCENCYSILHDKIFDILVLFCGENYFDLCLEVAHTEIIRDRFQFVSLNAEKSECVITVAADKEEAYFDRISNDIRDGHLDNVFTNNQITNMSYQHKLFDYLKGNEVLLNQVLSFEKESSPLLAVANQGCIYLVNSLIENGCNVNVLDNNGQSPLFLATDSDHIETVELLLKKAANPDSCNSKHISPLHMACMNGNIEMVKLLINSKCSINIRTDHNHTPLYFAALLGQTEIVQYLLENKCDTNIYSKNNNTLFHAACFFDNVKIVQLLIDFECDPSVLSVYNESALFVACLKNSILSVGLLLEKGSNPNLYTNVGGNYNPHSDSDENDMETTSDMLQNDPYEYICALLLENAELYENFCAKFAVDMNDFSFCPFKGSLIKPESSYNMTPLFMASSRGFIKVVKLLLEHNANPNLVNSFNDTPLFAACENGYTEIVKLLLEFQADPNLYNNYNVSPLQVVVANGFSDVVSLLLTHGANPNDNANGNGLPLILASQRRSYNIVALLLNFNADPNICNFKGETCLHLASQLGEVDIARLLLQHNADPNIVDNSLNTPLHIASHTVRNLVCITSEARKTSIFKDLSKLFSLNADYNKRSIYKRWTEMVKLLLASSADPFTVV
ncbi:uncharacterized protein [Mytilus edulis]|uniref:uncharacterized protein n=1 Tax=Mytilus edulis TaxID=6550 RepID=UPI0039F0B4DA